MSLEIDRRNDAPIPQEIQDDSYRHQAEKQSRHDPYSAAESEPTNLAPAQRQSGKRSTILLLGFALAIMTVLATLTAGIGGSQAAKRAHE